MLGQHHRQCSVVIDYQDTQSPSPASRVAMMAQLTPENELFSKSLHELVDP
jgi:hypothetical protein